MWLEIASRSASRTSRGSMPLAISISSWSIRWPAASSRSSSWAVAGSASMRSISASRSVGGSAPRPSIPAASSSSANSGLPSLRA